MSTKSTLRVFLVKGFVDHQAEEIAYPGLGKP